MMISQEAFFPFFNSEEKIKQIIQEVKTTSNVEKGNSSAIAAWEQAL